MCRTIETTIVKIRKDRSCFGCCELFKKGTGLFACKTVGAGRIHTIHLCDKCHEAAKKFSYGESFLMGELKELWDE